MNSFTRDDYVMDLAAEKIIVLDLDDTSEAATATRMSKNYMQSPTLAKKKTIMHDKDTIYNKFLAEKRRDDSTYNIDEYRLLQTINKKNSNVDIDDSYSSLQAERVCFSYHIVSLLTYGVACSIAISLLIVIIFIWRQKYSNSIKLDTVSIRSNF